MPVTNSGGGGGGGASDHIVPLELDAHLQAAPLTDYPEGVSAMPITGTPANWDFNGADAVVVTYYAVADGADCGAQVVYFKMALFMQRFWDYLGEEWSAWNYPQYDPGWVMQPSNTPGEVPIVQANGSIAWGTP